MRMHMHSRMLMYAHLHHEHGVQRACCAACGSWGTARSCDAPTHAPGGVSEGEIGGESTEMMSLASEPMRSKTL